MKDPESFEKPRLVEAEVVRVINESGIESSEAMEVMSRYVDQCQTDADAEYQATPGKSTSNRANIKAAIKIASIFLRSKEHKASGIESLQENLEAAMQGEDTADLAQEISSLLE